MTVSSASGKALATAANSVISVILIDFVPMKRPYAREWIIGALLLGLAGAALADAPANGSHRKKPPPNSTPPPQIAVFPVNPERHQYLTPFQAEYAAYLGNKSSDAARTDSASTTVVHSAPPTGPLTQAEQVDRYGLLSPSPNPQTPTVEIGDWNFTAAAHLAITGSRDTGAAVSAARGF
jgi:hypothetical protein